MPRNKVAWRRSVFVVLIIASLAVLTVSFRETESGPVHAVQTGVAGLLTPMQSWGARIAKPFQDGYEWLTTIWSAHKDAERLSEQVQTLQGQVIQLQEAGQENQRLKSLLDLKDKGTFPAGTDFVVARVIIKAPTHWQNWVTIDKGSDDGIKVDQAVVGSTPVAGESLTGKGLVGHVVEVTAHSAKIQLITDSDSSVMAKIQGSRAEGMVEGSATGRLTMDYVDRDIKVDPKLVVVTSGYGGVYPADIPIGIVTNVGEADVNAYRAIEVQSFLDFRVLEEVMVLIVPESTTTTYFPTTSTSTTSTTSTTLAPGTGGTGAGTTSTTTTSTTGATSSTTTTTAAAAGR
jgi:rod shape-determining protein MreC